MPPARARQTVEPASVADHADDQLAFIRRAMERSASFTHVSGLGGVATGLIALAAASAAASVATEAAWLTIWLCAAAASFGVSLALMARKSRAEGVSLLSGPARRFVWSMIPALLAGAVLTGALARAGLFDLLPATWLLLYGASVVTGGSHSVRPVPLMGAAFMVAGALAVVSPPTWGNAYMAAAFGGLHMVFGIVIWRKHGG